MERLFAYFKILISAILLLSSSSLYAASAPFPAPMFMNVYQVPSPFKANDKYFLVYEIYLTNAAKYPAKLLSFDIKDGNDNQLLTLNDLKNAIQGRSESKKEESNVFQPGEMKTAFIWVPLVSESAIPKILKHDLSIDSKFKDKSYTFNSGNYQINVNQASPIVVAPPLRGKNWLAGNAPSNTSVHRRSGLIFNGKPYIAQRFAIDFVQMGKDGKSFSGDIHDNKSYHCYNQDLYAVADGTVVELRDGIPENVPNSDKLAVTIDEKTIAGNHLILDLGNGKYAGYAHIVPGSFKVKLGDHVKPGQVLAKLGNSGNSSEPHLHFQIMNDKFFLKSDGIPYGFNHFFARPSQLIDDPNSNISIKVSDEKFKEYSNQLVLENDLINFD